MWPELLLVVALVVVNAAFAGTELALVSLRESQIRRLEARSATGRVVARLVREPSRFLATIQIGITLAGFLASAAAAVSLAEPLVGIFGFLGGAAEAGAIVAVTLVLSYFTLVIGELAPKRLAMQRSERWALLMARPLDLLMRITRPVVWLLARSSDVVVRLLGGDPTSQREQVTGQEIRDMVSVHETFSAEQRRILDGAFEISERQLDQLLVPRHEVFVIDADISCDSALEKLIESGHSRAPVGPGGRLDEVLGTVHLRDLVRGGGAPVLSVTKPALGFPEAAHALTALRELQVNRTQMAIVIDEYGAAVGIITVEDLVEELVGEIYDETDRDVIDVRREADGTVVLPGTYPMHDLGDIGIELPEGDYATIAGLVLDHLGRLPTVGECCEIDSWTIEVRAADQQRIIEVAISPVVS